MVLGPVGSWDVHGVPSTSYAIDGKVLSNYTAPTVESGTFESDVLYFTSPTLDQGKHTLAITNLNGTAPNVFWLDYILYAPTPLDEPATSIASDNAAPTSKSSSSSSPSSTSTEVPVSITTTESRTNVGAIAGGAAAGGVVLLAILGLLALWLLRRRRRRHQTDSHGIIDGTSSTLPTLTLHAHRSSHCLLLTRDSTVHEHVTTRLHARSSPALTYDRTQVRHHGAVSPRFRGHPQQHLLRARPRVGRALEGFTFPVPVACTSACICAHTHTLAVAVTSAESGHDASTAPGPDADQGPRIARRRAASGAVGGVAAAAAVHAVIGATFFMCL